jgi:hypothetical protein
LSGILLFQIGGLGVGRTRGEGNPTSKVSATAVWDEGIVGGDRTVEGKRLIFMHMYGSGVGAILLHRRLRQWVLLTYCWQITQWLLCPRRICYIPVSTCIKCLLWYAEDQN